MEFYSAGFQHCPYITVHASNLFSCAYSCFNHMQQFAVNLNPNTGYVFLLNPFSVIITIGLLSNLDTYAKGGKICEGEIKIIYDYIYVTVVSGGLFSNYLHLHAYEAVLRTRKQK
jgi:hypothetical protein